MRTMYVLNRKRVCSTISQIIDLWEREELLSWWRHGDGDGSGVLLSIRPLQQQPTNNVSSRKTNQEIDKFPTAQKYTTA